MRNIHGFIAINAGMLVPLNGHIKLCELCVCT